MTGAGTPELYLRTCFELNEEGRIVSTREPIARTGPLFLLVRGARACAWAVHVDVPRDVAVELDRLAASEPAVADFREPPVHAERYVQVLAGQAGSARSTAQSAGPAFSFPNGLARSADVAVVTDESLLEQSFRGWVRGEIAAGRGPLMAIFENDEPVSICFCARRTDTAAEAGVETAPAYRRKGFGAKVTAAWAATVRSTGRVPLYSTLWSNEASLGIARRLRLTPYAGVWSVERHE